MLDTAGFVSGCPGDHDVILGGGPMGLGSPRPICGPPSCTVARPRAKERRHFMSAEICSRSARPFRLADLSGVDERRDRDFLSSNLPDGSKEQLSGGEDTTGTTARRRAMPEGASLPHDRRHRPGLRIVGGRRIGPRPTLRFGFADSYLSAPRDRRLIVLGVGAEPSHMC